MKIAVIGHIRHAVAEPFLGGMEAHAARLCAGLRRAGHEVVLFAAAGSDDPALVPICAEPYEAVLPWEHWRGTPELTRYQEEAFGRCWDVIGAGGFDVVHNNSLFPDLIGWALRDGVPMVVSQHVPPFGAMREAVFAVAGREGCQVTMPSNSQVRLWFAAPPGNLGVVHNGIDTREWRPVTGRSGRLAWSGRITPNKGLVEAMEACRIAGLPLDIIGAVEDRTYFEHRVVPLLGEGIVYHGHLSGATLRAAVAQARAMLVTPMWDEPFGFVAAEALACGVPVIGFDRGAVAEVVGDCGIVVPPGDVAALAAALGRVEEIDRAACRARAIACFSLPSMIAGYERHYRAAMAGVAGATAAAAAAASASSRSSTAALLA